MNEQGGRDGSWWAKPKKPNPRTSCSLQEVRTPCGDDCRSDDGILWKHVWKQPEFLGWCGRGSVRPRTPVTGHGNQLCSGTFPEPQVPTVPPSPHLTSPHPRPLRLHCCWGLAATSAATCNGVAWEPGKGFPPVQQRKPAHPAERCVRPHH